MSTVDAAREAARATDGKFGAQPERPESEVELDGGEVPLTGLPEAVAQKRVALAELAAAQAKVADAQTQIAEASARLTPAGLPEEQDELEAYIAALESAARAEGDYEMETSAARAFAFAQPRFRAALNAAYDVVVSAGESGADTEGYEAILRGAVEVAKGK